MAATSDSLGLDGTAKMRNERIIARLNVKRPNLIKSAPLALDQRHRPPLRQPVHGAVGPGQTDRAGPPGDFHRQRPREQQAWVPSSESSTMSRSALVRCSADLGQPEKRLARVREPWLDVGRLDDYDQANNANKSSRASTEKWHPQ